MFKLPDGSLRLIVQGLARVRLSAIVQTKPYLKGAVEVADKDIPTRLRFFFDYLANPDVEIANDAYKEFANADYSPFSARS